MPTQGLPSYAAPPVVEVVCGVTFDAVPGFDVPLVGRFWADKLPSFVAGGDQVPLAPELEVLGRGPGVVYMGSAFPMPRSWLISPEGNKVVQIQRDRLLCNWRKTEERHEYPRFDAVSGFFRDTLRDFETFVEMNCKQRIVPRQFELTYVNHLAVSKEKATQVGDIGGTLPDVAWRRTAGRWLPEPEDAEFNFLFLLPDDAGRLRVKVQTAQLLKDRASVVVLDLTARGFGADRDAWFELAHTWIVKGFEDMVSPEMNPTWGKK